MDAFFGEIESFFHYGQHQFSVSIDTQETVMIFLHLMGDGDNTILEFCPTTVALPQVGIITALVAKPAKVIFSQACVTSTPGGGGGT